MREMIKKEEAASKDDYDIPFAPLPTDRLPLRMDILTNMRCHLPGKQMKEYAKVFRNLRDERLIGEEPGTGAGTHLIHPGATPTCLTSSKYLPRELAPALHTTTSQEAFQNPQLFRDRMQGLIRKRKHWLSGLAEDRTRAINLVTERDQDKRFEASFMQNKLSSMKAGKSFSSRPRLSPIGSTFQFKPQRIYETSSMRSAVSAGPSAQDTFIHRSNYGAFTAECDLPQHRGVKWGRNLHVIGDDNCD